MAVDRESELGGLWERQSGSGTRFLSGKLTIDGKETEVVVFWNQHKQEGERTPDWRVYRSQPRADAPPPQNGRSGPPQGGYRADRPSGRQVSQAVAAQAPGRAQTGGGRPPPAMADDLDDSIPFAPCWW